MPYVDRSHRCSGMLDGWRDSRGARLEKEYAETQGKTVIYMQEVIG